jgi:dienelactone hydrolase
VTFPAGERRLHGFLYRPVGDVASPAIVWSHGSEKQAGAYEDIGRFYAMAGYAVLVPHRHGHGCSPGEYDLAAVPARGREDTDGKADYRRRSIEVLIEVLEAYLEDTLAAVRWLRAQPFVDADRMAMSGVSHGGVQTLLAAEADAGVKAYVPFAPAAMAWRGNPELHERLLRAVEAAAAPVFLVQAANDYDLGPTEALGPVLTAKGWPNRAHVYPPYGDDPREGHGAFACHGMTVWGDDVLAFLDEALRLEG